MKHIQKYKKTKFGIEGIFIWKLYDIPVNLLVKLRGITLRLKKELD